MISRVVGFVCVAFCFAAAVSLSIYERYPFIVSSLGEGYHHYYLTSAILKFVEYWLRDGVWADRLLTLESPASIEAQTFAERGVYTSYLPGAPLQIWAVHHLAPGVPLATLISIFGVVSQVLVAVVCGLLVYQSVRDREAEAHGKVPLTYLPFVIAAMLTYLLHPAPFNFHALVYFGYQAAMLPFALALLTELLRRQRDRPLLEMGQSAIVIWLAFVDWLFIPLCLTLTLFRLISPIPHQAGWNWRRLAIRTAFQLWAGPALLCLLYLANLYSIGQLHTMAERAYLRMGIAESEPLTIAKIYRGFFVAYLGDTSWWLHGATIICCLLYVRDRRDPGIIVSLIGLLTCYVYVVLLPNDSVTHSFTMLKFFLPLAFVCFGVLPSMLISHCRGWTKAIVSLGAIYFIVSYLATAHLGWRGWFKANPTPHLMVAEYLRNNAAYEDVYLSPDMEILDNPPAPLAISFKKVWKVSSAKNLAAFLDRLPLSARPKLLTTNSVGDCASDDLGITDTGKRVYMVDLQHADYVRCLLQHWPN